MGIEVVCRMRLQKKPLVLVASVPTRGGPTCTIFLMDMRLQANSITSAPTRAGGYSGPPLRRDLGIHIAIQQSSSSNVATRSAVECGAQGPGAESDSFIISGASGYRRLRHEREASTAQAISITAVPTCAGGHGGPPLRRDLGIHIAIQQSSSSNVATRSAVECGARGPGAESDSFIISGISEYRRLRHEREASTAQANSITAASTCAGGHGGPPLRGISEMDITRS
jgi:hypothetical protein